MARRSRTTRARVTATRPLSLGEFAREIVGLGQDMGEKMAEVAEGTRDELARRLPPRTPASTGRLRAGWETQDRVTKSGNYVFVLRNPVEYAGYILPGKTWRTSKTGKRYQIGSDQAPNDVVRAVLDDFEAAIGSSIERGLESL